MASDEVEENIRKCKLRMGVLGILSFVLLGFVCYYTLSKGGAENKCEEPCGTYDVSRGLVHGITHMLCLKPSRVTGGLSVCRAANTCVSQHQYATGQQSASTACGPFCDETESYCKQVDDKGNSKTGLQMLALFALFILIFGPIIYGVNKRSNNRAEKKEEDDDNPNRVHTRGMNLEDSENPSDSDGESENLSAEDSDEDEKSKLCC